MQMNPHLIRFLETCEPEKLCVLQEWLELGMQRLSEHSSASPVVAETDVSLAERIGFSLVEEFGPSFQGKSCFAWVQGQLLRRFS